MPSQKPLRDLLYAPCLDAGLLFLRLTASYMLFRVHGWPKLTNYADELARIEDPFGIGPHISLLVAILAEVVCPLFITSGLSTRIATLPVLGGLLIAMVVVHGSWTLAEGQFGWLLLICFGTIALCGPGAWSCDAVLCKRKNRSLA